MVALGEGEDATAAWRALGSFDIDRLEPGSYALLPLLYRRLAAWEIGDPLLPRLQGVYRHTWLRNQLAVRVLTSVLETLHACGIETMVAGDAAVALSVYPELALRQIERIDVIIRAGEGGAAAAALAEGGWSLETERTATALASVGGLRLVAPGETTTVTLRTSLRGPAGPPHSWSDLDPSHTVELRVRGIPTRTPQTWDLLIRACVAGATGGAVRQIQWVADAVTILSREREVDWDYIVRTARSQRLTLPLQAALGYLTWLLGTQVPPDVQQALATTPRTRREFAAHRMSSLGGLLLGSFPSTVGEYIRATADEKPVTVVRAGPGFLRHTWGLNRSRDIPITAARAFLARRADARRRQDARRRHS